LADQGSLHQLPGWIEIGAPAVYRVIALDGRGIAEQVAAESIPDAAFRVMRVGVGGVGCRVEDEEVVGGGGLVGMLCGEGHDAVDEEADAIFV